MDEQSDFCTSEELQTENNEVYTFNNFQYETCLTSIYSDYVSHADSLISIFAHIYNNDYENIFPPEGKSFFDTVASGIIVGSAIGSLVSLITTGPSLSQVFSASALLIYFGIVPAVRGRNQFIKRSTVILQSAVLLYNELIASICNDIENTTDKVLTDEEIHSMTESLNNGEYNKKYELLKEAGKCPVYIMQVGINKEDMIYKIEDAALSRVYELLMHKIMGAEEGYEDIIREAYSIIKRYTEVKINPLSTEEEIKEATEELESLNSRLTSKGR